VLSAPRVCVCVCVCACVRACVCVYARALMGRQTREDRKDMRDRHGENTRNEMKLSTESNSYTNPRQTDTRDTKRIHFKEERITNACIINHEVTLYSKVQETEGISSLNEQSVKNCSTSIFSFLNIGKDLHRGTKRSLFTCNINMLH